MSKLSRLLAFVALLACMGLSAGQRVYEVFSENDKYVLYSAEDKTAGFSDSDGLLWVKIKDTGKVRLAVSHQLFGAKPFVEGAVLSRKNLDLAYAIVNGELPNGRPYNNLFEINLVRQTARLIPFPQKPWIGRITPESIVISDDGLFLAFQAEVGSVPDIGVAAPGIVKFGPLNSSYPKATVMFRDKPGWPRFTKDGNIILFEPCFDRLGRLLSCKTRQRVK